jgi:hypothetical protein
MRRGWGLVVVGAAAGLGACGDRTGLLLPDPLDDAAGLDAPSDGSNEARRERDANEVSDSGDASVDAADATLEASDSSGDATQEDVTEEDVIEEDALPPIDVTPPPPDAPLECADAGQLLVYVLTLNGNMMSFDPARRVFTLIGPLNCPTNGTPNSMAVDHQGIAYVNYYEGSIGLIFRVSTATLACEPTPYTNATGVLPAQLGSAFTANVEAGTETLYIAGDNGTGPMDISPLATVDTSSFATATIGSLPSIIAGPELTGTASGDLFAFYRDLSDPTSSFLGQIDRSTAAVVAQTALPGVQQGNGWAFGFWGGDFYFFTNPSVGTIVQRFRPSDGSIVQVASTSSVIVGAGVSTCAPQQ